MPPRIDPPEVLDGPNTRIFGIVAESGEDAAVEVVSSNTVIGVSGGNAPMS
jgi:hypothetical protein